MPWVDHVLLSRVPVEGSHLEAMGGLGECHVHSQDLLPSGTGEEHEILHIPGAPGTHEQASHEGREAPAHSHHFYCPSKSKDSPRVVRTYVGAWNQAGGALSSSPSWPWKNEPITGPGRALCFQNIKRELLEE